jgi:hypothetical protein
MFPQNCSIIYSVQVKSAEYCEIIYYFKDARGCPYIGEGYDKEENYITITPIIVESDDHKVQVARINTEMYYDDIHEYMTLEDYFDDIEYEMQKTLQIQKQCNYKNKRKNITTTIDSIDASTIFR